MWEQSPKDVPSKLFKEKLDILMREYCTSKLKKEEWEAFENVGADVLTNNLVSVTLNDDLKVEKNKKKQMSIWSLLLPTMMMLQKLRVES